jgi:transcriptional regulator with XRE-family HTH domain
MRKKNLAGGIMPNYDDRLALFGRVIGENLRRIRAGMTQTELSKIAGVSRNTIWACERGELISLENLIKIAEALHIHPAILLIEDQGRHKEMNLEEFIRVIVKEELRRQVKKN